MNCTLKLHVNLMKLENPDFKEEEIEEEEKNIKNNEIEKIMKIKDK